MPNDTTQTTGIALPSSGFFITGTDTDVGKTYAAACIAYSLTQQGKVITPRKPVASGCIRQEDGSLLASDAVLLKKACQTPDSLTRICPFQFEPAISPQTAIQQAGKIISNRDLIQACRFTASEFYLVEGAGGFYSPLSSDGLNRDLAVALQLPVILVVKNQLGCLNQALLSIEAIQNSGLKIAAIIVNFSNLTNYAADLKLWTDIPIWNLPYRADVKLQKIQELYH